MTSNGMLLQFPENRITRHINNIPSDDQKIQLIQKHVINKIVEENASLLATRLALRGVDITSETFKKNYALVFECLRSSIYKTLEFYHPLQEPMENMIKSIEIINNKQ